jgi:two-component system CheB/CheR fusion protein
MKSEYDLDDKALRESKEYFRQISKILQEVFWLETAGKQGKVLYISPTLQKVWERKRKEIYDDEKTSLDLIHKDDRKSVDRALRMFLKGKGDYSIEFRVIQGDGSFRWAWTRRFSIKNKAAKVYSGAGLAIDITDRKMVEEKLKQKQYALEASERELKNFSQEILSIREKEKKKLSSVLHDEVGCMAIALDSALNSIKVEIDNSNIKKALNATKKSRSLLRKFVLRLRKIAVDLRPPDLNIVGLPNALKEYFSKIEECENLRIKLHTDKNWRNVDDNTEIKIYRIIQEALNNIIKHAKANAVKVNLRLQGNNIKLSICDDGKGFDVEKNLMSANKKRIGILGMRELAESLNGTFIINSAPGKGTEISVTIPSAKK